MTLNLTAMKADTERILGDWGETLTIKRATSVAFDGEGKPTETWATVSTFTGDWQPVSGRTQRAEEGRQIKSDAQVVSPVDIDIQAADRVYKADGSYMTVNYVKKHAAHWTVFLTKTEQTE